MALKAEELDLHWHSDRAVTFPLGFRSGALFCGIKSRRKDIVLIASDRPCAAAGVYTLNLVRASSVDYSKAITDGGIAQAIFCNSGNANACTGEQGELDTAECAALSASGLNLLPEHVLVAATGIIGKALPMDKVRAGIPKAAKAVKAGVAADDDAAEAILTTDTFPKALALSVTSPYWQGELRFGGICKGSGMIAPNMATTLCFLTTDAEIAPAALQKALGLAMDSSFNRVTVDGDTSTNDMALILANGAGTAQIPAEGPAFHAFCGALGAISVELAKLVAKDGEGATKLVEIQVKGARTEAAAAQVAKTIAESPLVKTAFFGNDPNWGRIVAAAGRAGIGFDPSRMKVDLQGVTVFAGGQPTAFDPDALSKAMEAPTLDLAVDLGEGGSEATVWTCDFSYDYVRINAEYHT